MRVFKGTKDDWDKWPLIRSFLVRPSLPSSSTSRRAELCVQVLQRWRCTTVPPPSQMHHAAAGNLSEQGFHLETVSHSRDVWHPIQDILPSQGRKMTLNLRDRTGRHHVCCCTEGSKAANGGNYYRYLQAYIQKVLVRFQFCLKFCIQGIEPHPKKHIKSTNKKIYNNKIGSIWTWRWPHLSKDSCTC